jgi:hypothetical protein
MYSATRFQEIFAGEGWDLRLNDRTALRSKWI